MPLKGQQRIVAHHAAAVVDHPHQLAAAAFHLDPDASRPGIKSIFEQLLHHRRWPLHHLARGNLVCHLVGEYANPAHPEIVRFRLQAPPQPVRSG